ncbi:MAG: HD domain-containing protein [Candidatus Odinarchaeia archaeon]
MELKLSKTPFKDLLNPTGLQTLYKIISAKEFRDLYKAANYMIRAERETPHDVKHAIRTMLICAKLIDLVNEIPLRNNLYILLDWETVNFCMLTSAYLHDIGNYINRDFHSLAGSIIAFKLLDKYLENFKEKTLIKSVICHCISEHSPRKVLPSTVQSSIVALSDKLDIAKSRVAGYTHISFKEYATEDVLDVDLQRKGETIIINIKIAHPSALYRVEKLKKFLNLYDYINRYFEIRVEK